MIDKAQRVIQDAMTALVDDIDKSFLRKMQKKMHLCSANCCDDLSAGVDDVHKCIENCSSPLTQSQNFIQSELSQFQERLHRCIMVCQDRVRDKIGSNTSEAEVSMYKNEFESCAMICVDEHVQLMPSIKRKVTDMIR